MIMTPQQVRELAAQIRRSKMRKQCYALGPLLAAFKNEVHKIDGCPNFEDWYRREIDKPSSSRALWDILKD